MVEWSFPRNNSRNVKAMIAKITMMLNGEISLFTCLVAALSGVSVELSLQVLHIVYLIVCDRRLVPLREELIPPLSVGHNLVLVDSEAFLMVQERGA